MDSWYNVGPGFHNRIHVLADEGYVGEQEKAATRNEFDSHEVKDWKRRERQDRNLSMQNSKDLAYFVRLANNV
jgi:hypothetical protein